MNPAPPRAGIAAAACSSAGLALCALGGRLVSAPHATGGPMNFDLRNPSGAAMLCLGAAALLIGLPPRWRRAGWALAAMVSAGPVILNLWRFPPFLDGQTFAARLGVPDPDVAPAAAGFTAFGLFPAMLALAACWPGAGTASRGEPGAALAGWAVPAVAASCALFEGFNGAWWWFAPYGTARAAVLGVCVAAPVFAAWRPRHPSVRAAGAGAAVLLGLCCAMLWLEDAA